MATVGEWFFPLVMPFVLGRLLWLANSGRWQVINLANHPGVFWTAVTVWGLSFAGFLGLDLILAVQQVVRLLHGSGA
jgi:hypothetical protein